MNYDVDFFLNKFSAIDEKYWTTNVLTSLNSDGEITHCAFGWCGLHLDMTAPPEVVALRKLLEHIGNPADINDGYVDGYRQAHPRARIINALCDIRERIR